MTSTNTHVPLWKTDSRAAIGLIWEEYKYRHDLCWRLVFQLTAAAVVLATLPYAKTEVTKAVGYWILPVPLIGVALTGFGSFMMKAELHRLDGIRTRYRDLQTHELGVEQKRASTFTARVELYLGSLLILELINIGVLIELWVPNAARLLAG
jgi:hypothetical protein